MDNEFTSKPTQNMGSSKKSNGSSHTKTTRIGAVNTESPEQEESVEAPAPEIGFEAILGQVSENAEEILSEVQQTVEKTVRKYPVQSVLVCLGVGAVLGALWNSRR